MLTSPIYNLCVKSHLLCLTIYTVTHSYCTTVSWFVLMADNQIISIVGNLKHHLLFLIHQCLNYTPYWALYPCTMIHQRQYIDASTNCIIATLLQAIKWCHLSLFGLPHLCFLFALTAICFYILSTHWTMLNPGNNSIERLPQELFAKVNTLVDDVNALKVKDATPRSAATMAAVREMVVTIV